VLVEAIKKHQGLARRTDPMSVVGAAMKIIETVNWVFENAQFIQAAEMMGGGLDTVDELKEDRIEKEEEALGKAEGTEFYDSLDSEEDPEDWTVDDGYGVRASWFVGASLTHGTSVPAGVLIGSLGTVASGVRVGCGAVGCTIWFSSKIPACPIVTFCVFENRLPMIAAVVAAAVSAFFSFFV
jgi:hypothetical protein